MITAKQSARIIAVNQLMTAREALLQCPRLPCFEGPHLEVLESALCGIDALISALVPNTNAATPGSK